MDATAAGADVITPQASRALAVLYALPAGSAVSTTSRAPSANQGTPADTGLIIGPIIDSTKHIDSQSGIDKILASEEFDHTPVPSTP